MSSSQNITDVSVLGMMPHRVVLMGVGNEQKLTSSAGGPRNKQ